MNLTRLKSKIPFGKEKYATITNAAGHKHHSALFSSLLLEFTKLLQCNVGSAYNGKTRSDKLPGVFHVRRGTVANHVHNVGVVFISTLETDTFYIDVKRAKNNIKVKCLSEADRISIQWKSTPK